MTRLERLRCEAVQRGVLNESVHPPLGTTATSRPVVEVKFKVERGISVASCNAALQVYRDARSFFHKKEKKIEVVVTEVIQTEITSRPELHLRPCYVYGDVRATEYQSTEDKEDHPKAETSRHKPKLKDTGRKCRACDEDVGWPCSRLAPSSTGVDLARDVLVARAFQEKPPCTCEYPPLPSPLRKSYIPKSKRAKRAPREPGAQRGFQIMNPDSMTSLEDLHAHLTGMIHEEEFSKVENHGLLSPNYARHNASGIFEDMGRDTVSYIRGPYIPGWEETSLGRDTSDKDYIPPNSIPFPVIEDEPEEPDEVVEDNQPAWSGKKVTFAELPIVQRRVLIRSHSLDFGLKVSRVATAGIQRLRSVGSVIFKRNSAIFA